MVTEVQCTHVQTAGFYCCLYEIVVNSIILYFTSFISLNCYNVLSERSPDLICLFACYQGDISQVYPSGFATLSVRLYTVLTPSRAHSLSRAQGMCYLLHSGYLYITFYTIVTRGINAMFTCYVIHVSIALCLGDVIQNNNV